MATLRNTQLYAGTPPAPSSGNLWTDVYTVPAGHLVIVRNILSSNPQSSAKICQTRIDPNIVIRQVTQAAVTQDNFTTWVAIGAGQTLACLQQAGGATSYIVSGAIYFV